ncbi:MAG: ATP-binding protein [Chloroflexota bacterium]
MDQIYNIPLFDNLPEAELDWLFANSVERELETGTFFFREHGSAEEFYIVLEGELQITRMLNGQMTVMGTTPRGIIGGEQSLLNNTNSIVSARAIAPSRVIVLNKDQFRAMFGACPILSARILQVAGQRAFNYMAVVKQQEKMSALGQISAGLAHELNNPTAAVRRAVTTLRNAIPALQEQTISLHDLGLSRNQINELRVFQKEIVTRALSAEPLAPLEQSDREDIIGTWLDGQGIAEAWDMAAVFVTGHLTQEELEHLVQRLSIQEVGPVFAWLHSTLNTVSALDEIEQCGHRISSLVDAVRSYTYMDQAPVQDVNVHHDLDNTLKILQHKLGQITVHREYDPDLPLIQARGGELNQVWTNLIDNAIDVLDGTGDIHLVTRSENDYVMVEVADNGPGIPQDVMPRLFEPFFTTKDVGRGTGLGLDISYRIIQLHDGSIEVQSQPGQTRFIIRLPRCMQDETEHIE